MRPVFPAFHGLTLHKATDLTPETEAAYTADFLPFYRKLAEKTAPFGIDIELTLGNDGFTRTRKQRGKADVTCTRTFNDEFTAHNMRSHSHPANLISNQDFCWWSFYTEKN